MQVVNANKQVSTLEVSTDGGNTWQSTTRQPYNFFENSSGFGTTTVDVKVTSIDGDVVIVNNVDVSPDLVVTASANFPSSGTPATAVAAAAVASSSPSPAVPSSTPLIFVESPVDAAPSPSGGDFGQVATTSTSLAAPVSTITKAPTPTPSPTVEVMYVTVTIDACPA
jgi:hypothetical protein